MTAASLVRAEDCVLIVIDAQPGFLGKLPPAVAATLVDRIAWLARVAAHLGIPVIATVEEPDRNGSIEARIAEALPAGTIGHDKGVFGLADQPDILAAVRATRRTTAVLVGLETDVCVAHSAIGLAGRDRRVVVIGDATGAPGQDQAAGIERMRVAGVLVTTTKGLYYEWVRTVERAYEVETAVPSPPGLVL